MLAGTTNSLEGWETQMKTTLKLGITCALLWAGTAAAQDTAPATQLPQQVLPTGEEDAPSRAVGFAARAQEMARQSEEESLREMTSESSEGLETVRRPDGTVSLNLAGRFMHVMVATPTDDGNYVASCHVGEDARKHVHEAQEMLTGQRPKLKAQESIAVVDSQPVLEEK
jgi:hypothetical protein